MTHQFISLIMISLLPSASPAVVFTGSCLPWTVSSLGHEVPSRSCCIMPEQSVSQVTLSANVAENKWSY